MKTYSQAKADIIAHLKNNGWVMSDASLKVPHATRGTVRLWFKAQSVYASKVTYSGQSHTLGNAHSVFCDIRKLSPEQFVSHVEQYMA